MGVPAHDLTEEEVGLLRSQVSAGDSADRTVEIRTSKASMMGLLGSLSGIGVGHENAVGRVVPHGHFGPVDDAPNPYDTPAPAEVAHHAVDQPATDYHARIDADGDGRWDGYSAVRHADGSVDVYEDRNGDGQIDFVGHDRNGDGILESADYDENFDGNLETHMTDTNGDGWMDTRRVTGR